MRAVPKSILMPLPMLALLAACDPSPYHPGHAVTSAHEAPPALPGALGVPVVVAPTSAPLLSGSTVPPAAYPAVPVRMSANEIAATFANNTATGVTTNGLPYAAYFVADGTERFREGTFVDYGSWRVLPDGRLCTALTQLNGNVEECYIMNRAGNTIIFQRSDGVTVGNVTIVLGNPQGI